MTWRELLAWRERRELTQAAAAALVGRSERQWRRWESGKSPIPYYLLALLERVEGT